MNSLRSAPLGTICRADDPGSKSQTLKKHAEIMKIASSAPMAFKGRRQ
jgi:hypothetical protein